MLKNLVVSLCWVEDEQNNYTFLSFQAKLFQNKKQQKYFGNVNVKIIVMYCNSVLLMSSVWQHLMKPLVKKLSFL